MSQAENSCAGLENSFFELPALQDPPSILCLGKWRMLPLPVSTGSMLAGRERPSRTPTEAKSGSRGANPDAPLGLHQNATVGVRSHQVRGRNPNSPLGVYRDHSWCMQGPFIHWGSELTKRVLSCSSAPFRVL